MKKESYEHFKNQSFKYTDEEIFALVRLNRGYGIDNFVKKTYPSKKNQTKLKKYRFIQMFSDWKKESGEDLYEVIQDPDFVEMVRTEYEYRRITGRNSRKGYRWKSEQQNPQDKRWGLSDSCTSPTSNFSGVTIEGLTNPYTIGDKWFGKFLHGRN